MENAFLVDKSGSLKDIMSYCSDFLKVEKRFLVFVKLI